jgi:hypothetical protein
MPVFENLIPAYNIQIQTLLFDLNAFHSLAKLRLHSDTTVDILDKRITELGKSLRIFEEKVCPTYETKELPKETAARGRRNAKKKEKQAAKGKGKGKRKAQDSEDEDDSEKPDSTPPRTKKFNLCTYKTHAIGHYPRFIRLHGTTDNYTTQTVCIFPDLIYRHPHLKFQGEVEHKHIKRFYVRTNKTFKYVRQVTSHQRREEIVRAIKTRVSKSREEKKNSAPKPTAMRPTVPFQHSDKMPPTSPDVKYSISKDNSRWISIFSLMNDNEHDPAVKVCVRFSTLAKKF